MLTNRAFFSPLSLIQTLSYIHLFLLGQYLIWGYWIAPHTYIFQLFMYNEFDSIGNFHSDQFEDGEAVLKFYTADNTNVALNSCILVIFAAGFQILFAMVLYFFHTGLR